MQVASVVNGPGLEKKQRELSRLRTKIWQAVAKQAHNDAKEVWQKNATALFAQPSDEVRASEERLREAEDAVLRRVALFLR